MTAIDTVVAPDEGPPLHVHREQDEFIYVLDGTFTVRLAEELIDAEPGSRYPAHLEERWGCAGSLLRGLCAGGPAFEEWFTRYAELPAEQRGTEAFARLAAETQPFEVLGPPLS
jgi:hypothetical protein